MSQEKETPIDVTKVGDNGRTTIPKRARELLKLKSGDEIVWIEVKGENKEVRVRSRK
jgi:AbrB family looped-hinge helix DNA binding protein